MNRSEQNPSKIRRFKYYRSGGLNEWGHQLEYKEPWKLVQVSLRRAILSCHISGLDCRGPFWFLIIAVNTCNFSNIFSYTILPYSMIFQSFKWQNEFCNGVLLCPLNFDRLQSFIIDILFLAELHGLFKHPKQKTSRNWKQKS